MVKAALCGLVVLSASIGLAQEKWRVTDPNGMVYAVGHSKAEALERANRRSTLEGSVGGQFVAVRSVGAATAKDRLADETAVETLLRLETLRSFATTDGGPMKPLIDGVMNRYRESPDQIHALNRGLEDVFAQYAQDELQASRQPSLDLRLVAEPSPTSSFDALPAGFVAGYVALLERLDGYRPRTTVAPAPSLKRERLLQQAVLPGGDTRMVFETPIRNRSSLSVPYRLISRTKKDRVETVVTDEWEAKAGMYRLVATTTKAGSDADFASASNRIVEDAKNELDRIQLRENLRKEELRQAEEARLKREAEQKRLEEEKRQREEQERQAKEERQRQKAEYVRQVNDLQSNYDRAKRERDEAAGDLPDARQDLDRYRREAKRLKSDRDDAHEKVRDLESELEQAKKDGKPTGVIEGALREAREAYRSKKNAYEDADRRADSASDRVDALERAVRDRSSAMDSFETEIHRLNGLIATLGD